jgi:hypothetical protein
MIPSVDAVTTMTLPQPADTGTTGRPRILAQLGIDTAYVLLGFPLSIVAFTLVIIGLSLGGGLIPLVLLGIPILLATLLLARGFAEVERTRLALVLRQPRATGPYRQTDPAADTFRRVFAPFAGVQYWLDVVHSLVRLPISTVGFSIVLSWWATALSGVTYGLWAWALPEDPDGFLSLHELLGFQDTAATRTVFYLVIGLLFAVTLPVVVRGCALVEAWLGHALLNGVTGVATADAGRQDGSADVKQHPPTSPTRTDLISGI